MAISRPAVRSAALLSLFSFSLLATTACSDDGKDGSDSSTDSSTDSSKEDGGTVGSGGTASGSGSASGSGAGNNNSSGGTSTGNSDGGTAGSLGTPVSCEFCPENVVPYIGSEKGSLSCGDASCDATKEVCCYDGGSVGSASCVAKESGCETAIRCTSSANCPEGSVCCRTDRKLEGTGWTPTGVNSACFTGPDACAGAWSKSPAGSELCDSADSPCHRSAWIEEWDSTVQGKTMSCHVNPNGFSTCIYQ